MTQAIFGHVFMSYSRTDEDVMRRITVFLRSQGIKVWVDNEKLVPGTPIWEAEIEKAIISASATIVIMSPDSKDSVWVRREISYSDQHQKRIFPVLVRGDEDSSVSLRLITSQYVDIRNYEQVALTSLSAALLFYLEELGMREKKAREEAEKLVRAREEAARLKLEREAAEQAARVAEAAVVREREKREAAEREAREIEARAAHRQRLLDAMYSESVKLLQAEKYQQALDKLREIKKIDPKFPDRQKVASTASGKLARGTLQRQNRFNINRMSLAGVGILTLVITLSLIAVIFLVIVFGSRIPFGQRVYVVSLTPTRGVVGFGNLGVGVYPFSEGHIVGGTTLQMNGINYPYGLFAHAPSEIEYSLNRNFSSFSASIYIDGHPTCGGNGRAAFVILLDGQEIYRSPELTYSESQMPISMSIPVNKGKTLILRTESLGSTLCDWTVWGDPYLLPSILP